MAEFERAGQRNILDDFKYGAFVEDFNTHGKNAHGCQHKRSADYLNPTFRYLENGKTREILFSKAKYARARGTRPLDQFCKEWTCGKSQGSSALLETGGSELGSPYKCDDDVILHFENKPQTSSDTGALKMCTKFAN